MIFPSLVKQLLFSSGNSATQFADRHRRQDKRSGASKSTGKWHTAGGSPWRSVRIVRDFPFGEQVLAEHSHQISAVNRLGQIIIATSLDAFLVVALHGVGGQGNYRRVHSCLQRTYCSLLHRFCVRRSDLSGLFGIYRRSLREFSITLGRRPAIALLRGAITFAHSQCDYYILVVCPPGGNQNAAGRAVLTCKSEPQFGLGSIQLSFCTVRYSLILEIFEGGSIRCWYVPKHRLQSCNF